MALIENIQREDLNAVEIALAYQHLLDQYELTQERLSERIGKNRTTIANYLRLLKLPAPYTDGSTKQTARYGTCTCIDFIRRPQTSSKNIRRDTGTRILRPQSRRDCQIALSEGEAVKSGTRKITPKRSKLPEEFNLLKQQLTGFSTPRYN